MVNKDYDFCGWATRNDLTCSDGRVIRKNAFKNQNGETVPLCWNHEHNDPSKVLGHALLENRDEGVYAYCFLNDNEAGHEAKELVQHGDVRSLSIFANQLQEVSKNVIHGMIREVSLVLAGANPGAFIDNVIEHSDTGNLDAMTIGYDENITICLQHSDDKEDTKMAEEAKKPETEETVEDVFNTLTDKQKTVVYALIAKAIEDNKEEETDMKHSVFENCDGNNVEANALMHTGLETILADAKSKGSLKESFLAHADEYGIQNIEFLFPDAQLTNKTPIAIDKDTNWVDKFMAGVGHSPFSRIKMLFSDLTEDAARAKGYIKGKLKKEEVFSLLKRSISPTTVYKKQKLDRDDQLDIKDFDVVSLIKGEMRKKLNAEIARAALFGDGRLASDDDKINEANIIPVINDADLFVIRWGVADGATTDDKINNFAYAAVKARKNYKGSGRPVMFTTEDMLTDMLLQKDSLGYRLYKSEAELATALRVREIITCPEMENLTDKDGDAVYAVILNLDDYKIGADKGGSINMFEDFDIDYNQMKYLIETRCSGGLTVPFSAIVLKENNTTESLEPTIAEATAPFKA